MADGGSDDDGSGPASQPPAHIATEGTARFGPPTNLSVHVRTDNLNIQPSNLAALERLAQHSPEIAAKLIDASTKTVGYESRRYTTAAIAAGTICCVLLVCSTAAILGAGLLAGDVFFFSAVSVAAIVAAIFTGKVQDLSWTIKALNWIKSPPE